MLNVSECGHPGPWAKNQAGAIVDAQGCEVITAWDGTASINLAVLRNPTDEDVERAAQTQYETNGYWQWHDATEPEREDARRDFIRGLTAYLGGGEA
jgi:hypothetical protein